MFFSHTSLWRLSEDCQGLLFWPEDAKPHAEEPFPQGRGECCTTPSPCSTVHVCFPNSPRDGWESPPAAVRHHIHEWIVFHLLMHPAPTRRRPHYCQPCSSPQMTLLPIFLKIQLMYPITPSLNKRWRVVAIRRSLSWNMFRISLWSPLWDCLNLVLQIVGDQRS